MRPVGFTSRRGRIERVLDEVERRGLYADRVDWPEVRERVRSAPPDELLGVLREVAKQAGGAHSGVLLPGAIAARAARPLELPSATLAGGAGVLVLPACPGTPRVTRAYIAAGTSALRSLPQDRGLVVDLRGNGGGSMWPMLAVAAPLLGGDGELGAFVTRDGARMAWWLRRGRVGSGRRTLARARPAVPLPGPVGVLTGARTASSGEAVAVAFRGLPHARSYGAPTLGFSTGNEALPLPGGGALLLTTCRFADRTGVVYGGPLPPDVPCGEGRALAEALAGLAGH